MIDRRRDNGLPPPGAIVVAAGGVGGLEGPLRLAAQIAQRHRVPAHVVGAVSPLSPVPRLFSAAMGVKPADLEQCRRSSEHARLSQRLEEEGHATRFGLSVLSGDLVETMSAAARSSSSPYALMGLPSARDPLRRLAGTRAVQLARTGVPVLAVPDGATELPRSALVCIDPAEGSSGVAQAAARLLAEDGELVLTHVAPAGLWRSADARRATDRLHQLAVSLELPPATRVYIVILQADPVWTFARSVGNFDLVALGVSQSSRRPPGFRPSITQTVLRHATGSVLLAPLTRSSPDSSPASPAPAPNAAWRSSPTRSPSSHHSSGTAG